MPRSKRNVRASGVGRSLGAYKAPLIECICCHRKLPRESIAHIGRKPLPNGKERAVCGECWHSGRVWREA